MKTSIKILFLTLTLLMIPIISYSIDFGFGLHNRTVLHYDQGSTKEVHAEQKNLLVFWLNHYFQEDYYFTLKAHGEIGTEYSHSENKYKFLPSGDIDTLAIGGKTQLQNSPTNFFGFQVGRQFFTDFTKEILFTPADGVQVGIGLDSVEINIALGYTGLIYRWSNTSKIGLNDITNSQNWAKNRTDTTSDSYKQLADYSAKHAPPRLIGNIIVKAPSLFRGQDLYFAFLAQADLWNAFLKDPIKKGNTTENNSIGSPIHTLYAGLGLKGAATSSFYYNIFAYLNSGSYLNYQADTTSSTGFSYQNKAIVSGLVGFDLEGFFKKALYSHLKFAFRYASGDDGNADYYGMKTKGSVSSLFIPISGVKNNLVFNPQLSNLITMGLTYTFKPFAKINNEYLKHFLIGAEIKSFLRGSEAGISEQSIMTTSNNWYIGSELDILINLIAISDFNMFVSSGAFFPNETEFQIGFNKPRLEAELNFSIRL